MSQHSIKFFFCYRKSLSINAVNNKNDELGEKRIVQYVSTKCKLQKAYFQEPANHKSSYVTEWDFQSTLGNRTRTLLLQSLARVLEIIHENYSFGKKK